MKQTWYLVPHWLFFIIIANCSKLVIIVTIVILFHLIYQSYSYMNTQYEYYTVYRPSNYQFYIHPFVPISIWPYTFPRWYIIISRLHTSNLWSTYTRKCDENYTWMFSIFSQIFDNFPSTNFHIFISIAFSNPILIKYNYTSPIYKYPHQSQSVNTSNLVYDTLLRCYLLIQNTYNNYFLKLWFKIFPIKIRFSNFRFTTFFQQSRLLLLKFYNSSITSTTHPPPLIPMQSPPTTLIIITIPNSFINFDYYSSLLLLFQLSFTNLDYYC